ncbi:Ldh family oxidoreductase [Caballeronia sp. LZ035]|uniref:Ldh family oxidoreductase n=1 Tax=Caballeronia sp. LZ035 TaxID=3038568 RepID=UPI002854F3E5|nr:Ldh family oxidoreductase [Caballeronia sp. LZ035]MDR5758930.1 Ldh family oxidoreductase [Caballeronia sp. LZ035]
MKALEFDEASAACIQALELAGVPTENARIQTDLFLEAELRGRPSHGVQRLPRVVERIRNGVADPAATGRGTWRGDSFLDVDGQRGLGPVVAFAALAQIAARAKTTGIAVAAIRNCNHIGMLALYAERIAQKGQILIALTTSEALVHPWGGRRAMVGTNPVAIGVPAQPRPFVLDMATSLVSMGQIHDHANRRAPLVPGWALDANGDPTTDAAAARDGAIAPFGGPKGYALGLALEVLVASLTDSAIGRDVRGTLDATQICNKGDVFIVLEPAGSAAGVSVSAYLDAIRACEPADPGRPVVVPGDRAQVARERSLAAGLSIPDGVWQDIVELANPSTTISQANHE